MSPVALLSSFIFAAAAVAAYPAGWVCGLYGSCSISQMLGCAASIMFLAYLVSDRLEAQSRKTGPRLLGTRAEQLIDRRSSEMKRRLAISNKWRATGSRPSRAGASGELLMLPSPSSPPMRRSGVFIMRASKRDN
jgi:hypothetical protein